MNDKISDKDKLDWENFLSSNEKLSNKDLNLNKKKTLKTKQIDLHGFTLLEANETVEKFISKIVRNLEGLGESEIPTPTIGKFIMEGLSSLDKVAYVRFASVYKNFKEAKDFEQFVGNLDDNKS